MRALVIIDVQQGMFGGPAGEPHDGEGVVARLASVLARAREANVPVFFVQHDGGTGSPLAKRSAGFDFHTALAPLPGEDVTVKEHCSVFQATDLHEKLIAAGIDHIVVGGMQSEFCVDTAVHGAFERGIGVTLVSDGHTTFDTPVLGAEQIVAHHNWTLSSGGFAELVEAAEVSIGAGEA